MAKSVAGIRPTVAILIAFLLIVSLVVPTAEGVICPLESKRSKTWSGVCIKSKNCDKQCKTWERAKHGACHATYRNVLGVKEIKRFCCCLVLCLWIVYFSVWKLKNKGSRSSAGSARTQTCCLIM